MGLIGIDNGEIREYISKYDPDTANPTIFKLGPLDARLKNAIMDGITNYSLGPGGDSEPANITLNINQRNFEIVRFGVRDIVNLLDPRTKKPVKFDTVSVPKAGKNYKAVSDVIMDMIPLAVMKELAGEIMKDIGLSEEEEKN